MTSPTPGDLTVALHPESPSHTHFAWIRQGNGYALSLARRRLTGEYRLAGTSISGEGEVVLTGPMLDAVAETHARWKAEMGEPTRGAVDPVALAQSLFAALPAHLAENWCNDYVEGKPTDACLDGQFNLVTAVRAALAACNIPTTPEA